MTDKPIEKVEIHDLAYGGDGVGRLADGRAVFVPLTIPGEVIEVELTDERPRFARGRAVALSDASPLRVEPACPLFGSCGGCQYQHIAYDAQVQFKSKQFTQLLERVGRLRDIPTASIFQSPCQLGYRNKLVLEPFVENGRTDFGFFSHWANRFIPIGTCPLAHPEINCLLPDAQVGALAGGEHAQPLLLRKPTRGPAVWFTGKPGRHADWLREDVGGGEVRVPPGAFWQVNPGVGSELARQVTDWACSLSVKKIVDAYAGVGLFSLAVGKRCADVVLIETDRVALEASRWNHRHLKLPGREYVAGSTEQCLPGILAAAGGQQRKNMAVVLDPPRGGCHERVVGSLLDSPVACIIYVSCNPATLARDLNGLCAKDSSGYRVVATALADMFPQTAHFESAVLLKQK